MKTNTFPVIDSILSPMHLALWLTEQYHLTNVTVRLLKANMNHTYRVAAEGEDYILRVYNHGHRQLSDVAEEVRLLNELKELMTLSYPIVNTAKEFIGELNAPEGKRYAVLFSFAKGKKMRHLTKEQNLHIGMQVGTFHQYTLNKTLERTGYTIEKLIGWAHGQLTKYIPAELEEMKLIKNCEAILAAQFNKHLLRSGIVHLDIWYDNMAIQEDGTTTLFDFDNCGNGWLILDIGYYCMQLFYTEPQGDAYEQKKAAFIEGYRSKTPVSDTELELVPYAGLAIWIYYLGVQAQRFDNFANIFLSENYVRMMIEKVKTWLRFHNITLSE